MQYCFILCVVVGIYSCFECKKPSDDLTMCSVSSCGRYYHLECLNHLGVGVRKDSSRIICPRHSCATCVARLPVKSSAKKFKGFIQFLFSIYRVPMPVWKWLALNSRLSLKWP